jgi:hypothetical protein
MNLKSGLKAVVASAIVLFGLVLGSGKALGMNRATDVAKATQAKLSNYRVLNYITMNIGENICSFSKYHVDIIHDMCNHRTKWINWLGHFESAPVNYTQATQALACANQSESKYNNEHSLEKLSKLEGDVKSFELQELLEKANADWDALPKTD